MRQQRRFLVALKLSDAGADCSHFGRVLDAVLDLEKVSCPIQLICCLARLVGLEGRNGKLGDMKLAASTHMLLGNADRGQNKFTTAVQHFSAALYAYRNLEDSGRVAECTLALGDVERRLGRFGKARLLVDEARNQYDIIGRLPKVAECLHILADIDIEEGQREAARAKLENAGSIYRQLEDNPMLNQCLARIATLSSDNNSNREVVERPGAPTRSAPANEHLVRPPDAGTFWYSPMASAAPSPFPATGRARECILRLSTTASSARRHCQSLFLLITRARNIYDHLNELLQRMGDLDLEDDADWDTFESNYEMLEMLEMCVREVFLADHLTDYDSTVFWKQYWDFRNRASKILKLSTSGLGL